MPTWDAGLASGYILRLDVWLNSQDQANNRSNVGWHLHIIKGSGSGKWADGPHYWSVGNAISGSGSIGSYDFRNYSDLTLGSGSNWVGHDGNGNATPYFSGAFNDNDTWGELGDASTGGYWTLPRIPKVPGAPTNLWGTGNPDQIGPTSMRYRFSGTTDGGSTILEWQAQRATDAAFTQNVQTVSSNGTTVFTGLNPDTRYYFRARGRNAVGWGPYGAQVNAMTLSTTPPTLSVLPAATGLSATLTITPPASLPNPDSYVVERRIVGTTDVTTLNAPSSPYVATGLTAGAAYEWRAAMKSGSYTSDFSPWVAATQPAPNTSPGDYFDGATAAKVDNTYVWDGTANLSTSRAVAKEPTGWAVNAATSSGTAVIMRQTGGRSQAFGARVVFLTDTLNPGFKAGQAIAAIGRADAAAGGRYWGSIHVQIPARSQRMAAVIDWLDGAGAVIGTSAPGEAVLVAPSASEWTRLSVFATAPAGTVFAATRSIDVAGAGWATWKGGDVLILDDAMLTIGELYPYFDGNTPDTSSFTYAWLAGENASASTRTTVLSSTIDPFADPDCPPPPLPPRPPVIVDDCIEEVGTWRRYWASIPAQHVLNWLAELPTITLRTAANAERQIRIRIYENPDAVAPDAFTPDGWASEQIVSFMPAGSEYVLNGVDETMMGSVDAGESWTNLNHLLYGTGSTPASWPVLACGIGYLVSFDVPLEAPAGNLSIDIALTRRY